MVGEAIQGANEGLGGFNASLRGILDAIFSIQDGFGEAIRFIKGTFTGDWS